MHKIGEELRASREKRDLTMEEVVAITKIDAKFLEALEEGNFDVLPDPYVKAFLRAYASAVGANVTTIMREFEEARQKPRSEQISEYTPETPIEKPKAPRPVKKPEISFNLPQFDFIKFLNERRNLLLSAAGIIAVIIIAVMLLRNKPADYEQTAQSDSDNAQSGPSKALNFSVTASEPVYLMVSMDGGDSLDYNLAADENQRFQADESIWILTSDAGASDFIFNGDKLDKPAAKDFTAHFIVDKDGMRSVKAYKPVVIQQ